MVNRLAGALVVVLLVGTTVSAVPANITVTGYGRVQSASDTVSVSSPYRH